MHIKQTVILDQIKKTYKNRLILPALYLVSLAALWLFSPITQLASPIPASSKVSYHELKNGHFTYITTTLEQLHFTGYTRKFLGYVDGYYYYTFQGGDCLLVLLGPKSCREGLAYLEKLPVRVRIEEGFGDYDALANQLAADLNWTVDGVKSQVPNYLLSEPGFRKLTSLLLLGFYFLSGAFALADACLCISCIWSPSLSAAYRKLGAYGDAKQLLSEAEDEWSETPQPICDKIWVTRQYLIAFSAYRVAIVPISEILSVYKHAVLHKLIWRKQLRLSYTLYLTAKKRLYLQLPVANEEGADKVAAVIMEQNPAVSNRPSLPSFGWASWHRKRG